MKNYRKEELKFYVLGNILIILLLSGVLKVVSDIDLLGEASIKNVVDLLPVVFGSALLSSIMYIYIYILDSLVPSEWKDWIAYFPCGRPGDTVFSKIERKRIDSRFTQDDAISTYNEIYEKLSKITDCKRKKEFQNSKWYRIYQSIETDEMITLSQKDFLLNRDMCSMTLVITIIYLLVGIISKFYAIQISVLLWLAGEFVVINLATKYKAKKFVYNVIAKDIYSKHIEDEDL